MKSVLTAGLIVCLASPLMAETTAEKAPSTPSEKQSYSIGANVGTGLGNDLKQSGVNVDPEMLVRGVRDGLAGKPTLSEEERESAMAEVMKQVQSQAEVRQREAAAEQQKAGTANKTASEKFLEENKKKEGVKTTASGLQYKEEKTGDGKKPTADDVVEVHYRGTLIDGTEFDSSYKRNQTTSFPLKNVIPGWTEGLQLMPVGSKWTFYIPSELAYGENAPPAIGPNQALVFEVELVSIKQPE